MLKPQRQRQLRRLWLTAIVLAWGLSPAVAHELWVAPRNDTPKLESSVTAALKVGQMMEGTDYPYLSNHFQSFTITTRRGTQDARGIEGDSPALSYPAEAPGLNIIAYHATPHQITFDTLTEFAEYLEYEGLGEIVKTHQNRDLPSTGISESYIRCAKALVQVGPVTRLDQDKSTGMPFEIIAETNPYTDGLESLSVILTWQGEPVARRQIAIFRRYDGKVTRMLAITGDDGRAIIPLFGGGEFLLNAVNIEPVSEGDIVWKSHWASLTFGLRMRK